MKRRKLRYEAKVCMLWAAAAGLIITGCALWCTATPVLVLSGAGALIASEGVIDNHEA